MSATEMLPLIEQEAAERQAATRAKPGEKVGTKATQKVGEPFSPDRHEREAAAAAAAITGTNRQHGKEGGRGRPKTVTQKVESPFSPNRNETTAAAEAAAR
ncbi:hypothetical protein [Acidobacterium sp. S8]|uniref:hypothetical protein n=1 Tax=Acidobacterium sp. S8 TaxID=1641854 RepID=UPI00131AF10F|nr:hypothetical protein [Acidobacterium sp. S8]